MSTKPIFPRALQRGARVALLAPAGPLRDARDVERAREHCLALGFVPVVSTNARNVHGYLAGTDEQRLSDLNTALRDPDVDAIWCLRGGNGLMRIIDRVDYAGFARAVKPVIGYSDITALLLALWCETGAVTFHGPVARTPLTPFVRECFEQVLCQAAAVGALPIPRTPSADNQDLRVLTRGVARGPLIGGNLSLIQCLAATRYMPDLDGAILFLEDISEPVYRIDRMLAHLRVAGVLDQLAGVAIGTFTGIRDDDDGSFPLDDVLHMYFDPLGIPVVAGFPIGHIDEQWTVPIGVMAELDGEARRITLDGRQA